LGFSIGSRVIYSCLLELAKKGAYGLIDKVIIFGSPFVVSPDQLTIARSMVSGDFINGYSKKDWILGYLFRATSGGLGRVAGLSPVDDAYGIQNFDCTEFVQGHLSYRKHMPFLLSQLGFSVLSDEFIEIDDEPDPEQTERQRKLINEFDEAKKIMEDEIKNGLVKKKKHNGIWGKLFKSKKKEWWEMYSVDSAKETSTDSLNKNEIGEPEDVFDVDALIYKAQELEISDDKEGKYDGQSDIPESSEQNEETTEREGNDNVDVEKYEPLTLAEELEEQEDDEETDITESVSESTNTRQNDYDDHDEFSKEEKIVMTFA
jgi:hypothetical protein